MDLFTITCTTCKSRLKVRDAAAIGQILACPKCNGLVMVKPPPSWSTGESDQKSEAPTVTDVVPQRPAVGQTLSNSAFEAVEELLSDAPPRITPPAVEPPATPPPRRGFVGAPAASPPAPPPASKPAAQPLPEKSAAARPAAAPAPVPARNAEQPVATAAVVERSWQFWTLVAGSAAAGIILAFAAVTLTIYFLRAPLPAMARANRAESAPANVVSMPPPAPPAEFPGVISSAQAVESDPLGHQPALPAGSDQAPPALPEAPPSPQGSPKSPPSQTPLPSAASDPLGLVNDPPAPAASTNPLSDGLAKFDRLLAGEEGDPLVKSEWPAPRPADVAAGADEKIAKPPAPRPPPRDIDVAKRLLDPIAGIESSGTLLADFLQVISDYSTIPITLVPQGLAAVNVTAATPVSIKAANTTVGGALADALRPLKLEYVAIEDQVIVRLAEPNPPVIIEVQARELADGTSQELAALAELLQSLIEPGSWGDAEDAGSIDIDETKNALRVRHSRAVQAQILLACDKLRVARGKTPLLKIDPAALQLDSRWSLAKPRLDTPISLNFSQPARLVTILQRLGEAADVRILVDWQDVASAGWNPAAEASLVADKQPLSAALDALLTPLDLSWRVIDGRTLQVVTPAQLSEALELELYPAGGLVAGDSGGEKLLKAVRQALGESTFRDTGGNGEIRFDPPSKCLLAALPQPKQKELETLLRELKSKVSLH